MSPRVRFCLFAGAMLLAAVGGVWWFWFRISPEAAALRKRFPYVSLSGRLSFEAEHGLQGGNRQEPILLKPAIERLETGEQGFWLFGVARMQSLQKLHSREATRFVNSQGNGLARFRSQPSPRWLDYEEPEPIPLPRDVTDSAYELAHETVTLKEQELDEGPDGAWTPSLKLLGDFHDRSDSSFVSAWSIGDVRDRDHVAGFVSHGFSELPVLAHPENRTVWSETDGKCVETRPERWTIARLELVGLLKFDAPVVYVSDNLPRMNELVDARTRPLNSFEMRALETLQAGEYLVATADRNHIEMLGSLRATKHCLKCHSGARGSLLGAFSYRLRREPPLPVAASAKKPST